MPCGGNATVATHHGTVFEPDAGWRSTCRRRQNHGAQAFRDENFDGSLDPPLQALHSRLQCTTWSNLHSHRKSQRFFLFEFFPLLLHLRILAAFLSSEHTSDSHPLVELSIALDCWSHFKLTRLNNGFINRTFRRIWRVPSLRRIIPTLPLQDQGARFCPFGSPGQDWPQSYVGRHCSYHW